MASQGSRSGTLFLVFERLRADGRLSEGEVLKVTGGALDAEETMRLLVSLRFAERSDGFLSATKLLGGQMTREQTALVEDFVLGKKEAEQFRHLMDSLRAVSAAIDAEPEFKIAEHSVKKAPVDNETVKRYAKEFLDVSDIAARQKMQKKVGK